MARDHNIPPFSGSFFSRLHDGYSCLVRVALSCLAAFRCAAAHTVFVQCPCRSQVGLFRCFLVGSSRTTASRAVLCAAFRAKDGRWAARSVSCLSIRHNNICPARFFFHRGTFSPPHRSVSCPRCPHLPAGRSHLTFSPPAV